MAKTVEVEVVHPRHHLMVGGKMKHIKPGTKVNMTEAGATRAIELGKVKLPSSEDTVDVSGDEGGDGPSAELVALRERATALGLSGFGRLGVDKLTAAIKEKEAEGGQD